MNIRESLGEAMADQDGSAGSAIITDRRGVQKVVDFVTIGEYAVVEGDIVIGRLDEIRRVGEQPRSSDSLPPTGARPPGRSSDGLFPPPPTGVVMNTHSGDSHGLWPRIVGSGPLSRMVPLIPYELDPALPRPERIHEAMAKWTFRTAIEFAPRFNQPNWVYFTRGPSDAGGFSHIGMQGGRQEILLNDTAEFGVVMHEIGHTVGLWHEQSRSDRDRFVTVYIENIDDKFKKAFGRHTADEADDVGPYDYNSIMHYSRKAFSRNGADTIVPTDPDVETGQRRDLSDGDIVAVRALYPTELVHNPTPPDPPIWTEHGGNPR